MPNDPITPIPQPRAATDSRPHHADGRPLWNGADRAADAATAEPSVPVHPHPLSNDLTDEALPPRSPREEEAEAAGVGAAPRHVGKVIGGVIIFFVAMALIGTAVMLGERWELILLGGGIFVLYVVFIGAPILLAAGTKAAQDEAVRDEKTHPSP